MDWFLFSGFLLYLSILNGATTGITGTETPPYVVTSSQTPQRTNSTELSDLLSAIMLSERMVCVVGFKAKARRGAGDGGACVEHMCTCTDTYTRMVWLKVKTNTESSYILVLV